MSSSLTQLAVQFARGKYPVDAEEQLGYRQVASSVAPQSRRPSCAPWVERTLQNNEVVLGSMEIVFGG